MKPCSLPSKDNPHLGWWLLGPKRRSAVLLCALALWMMATNAHAQKRRRADLELFSAPYQARLVQGYVVKAERKQALAKWVGTLRDELAKPRKERRNETSLHEQFFSEVFVEALGYAKRTRGVGEWTIRSEGTTDVDLTRPDGRLGFFSPAGKHIDVVIELKGLNSHLDLRQTRKTDKRTPVDQAFSYAHKFDAVQWVIVSNYRTLRLYHRSSSKYALHFDLTRLADADQTTQRKLFFRLLARENLIAQVGPSPADLAYAGRQEELKRISRRFYGLYKRLRRDAVAAMLKAQPSSPSASTLRLAQTLLERMLFIAFAEDTGLIPPETLERALHPNRFRPAPVWDNIKGLFRDLHHGNPRLGLPAYNGGLFAPNPALAALPLSNELMQGFKRLADYDFRSDLRVNILGQVFEQSITDLEVLKGKLAGEATTKDTRRHDEGAYYTPDTVTEWLIERTLGTHLASIRKGMGESNLARLSEAELEAAKDGKVSQGVRQHIAYWQAYIDRLSILRVLDPSCGSGAFLVAAFDLLHAEGQRVNAQLRALHAKTLLTKWEAHLLQNVLYGVDISHEAAEITRLSLWLKIAQHKQPLVALNHNIRVGNAVVDDARYDAKNAFDWQHAFPQAMAAGGFDVVLGNPPYVRHELIKAWKPALKKRFATYHGRADLYVYFYELGYQLLKPGGHFGYITSNKFMRASYGQKLRGFLTQNTRLKAVLDLAGEKDIFPDAKVDPAIVVFEKAKPNGAKLAIQSPPFHPSTRVLPAKYLTSQSWLLQEEHIHALKAKMERVGTPFKNWPGLEINAGIKTGYNEAFVIDDAKRTQLIQADVKSAQVIKPLLRGRDIERWHINNPNLWLIFTRRGIKIDRHPAIKTHLKQYRSFLEKRAGKQAWYELQSSPSHQRQQAFEKPKLIYPEIKSHNAFTLEKQNFYHLNSAYHITSNHLLLPYLAAVLNSQLALWWFKNTLTTLGSEGLRFKHGHMQNFPLPHADTSTQQRLGKLAKELTSLHAMRQKQGNTPALQAKIAQASVRLNKAVEALYGLTEDEVGLIGSGGEKR